MLQAKGEGGRVLLEFFKFSINCHQFDLCLIIAWSTKMVLEKVCIHL